MLRFILLTIALILIFPNCSLAQTPSIFINNRQLIVDSPAYIENGRTLVPVRAIFEALGRQIIWDDQFQTVKSGDIWLQINNPVAIVGSKQVFLDVPATIKNNRTYVPLRFVSESVGAKVNWIEDLHRIDIIKQAPLTVVPQSPGVNYNQKFREIKSKTDDLFSYYFSVAYTAQGLYYDSYKRVCDYVDEKVKVNDAEDLDKKNREIYELLQAVKQPPSEYYDTYDNLVKYHSLLKELQRAVGKPSDIKATFVTVVDNIAQQRNRLSDKLNKQI